MVSKSASQSSPRRQRARLNSRGSVQHQVTLFDYIAQHAHQVRPPGQGHAGPPVTLDLPDANERPQQVQVEPGQRQATHPITHDLPDEQPQQVQVEPLVQQLGNVHLEELPAEMDVQGRVVANKINEQGKLDLAGRVNPCVPGPLAQVMQDDEGWGEIDKLSAWECALSTFPAIEEIPAQHREVWALAMNKVHRKIWEAQEEGDDLDRALKWWFFLPQALARKAQRGGRAGVGQIMKRFNAVVKGDFGELVNLWQHDKEVVERKEEKRNRVKPSSDMNKKSRQALSLLSKGFISKATNRMTSHGVASIEDPKSKAALASKYPPRIKEMPPTVNRGQCVDTMRTIRDSWLALKGGVAPGTGQLRPEFLVTLAEVWEEGSSSWDMVNSFAMRHVKGEFPPWYYKVCMSVETVGMFKTAAQDPSLLRPIGMKNPNIKINHKEVIRQNKSVLTKFLEPTQLGMSVAGEAKLVHSVRMMMEENRDFTCIKLDFRNAFNELWRSRIVDALEKEPSLQHLAAHAATILAPGSGLESRGALWGESMEGVTQGDPESGPFFCVAIQEFVTKVDRMLVGGGGCARFGWDDGYLLGPTELGFKSLNWFSKEVEEKSGLVLQRSKQRSFARVVPFLLTLHQV